MRLVVTPSASPLRGVVPGPIDARAATYAIAIAALCERRESELTGRGLPQLAIVGALRSLGVSIDERRDARGRVIGLAVRGRHLETWQAPEAQLDAADDASAMAALASLAVGLPFSTTLSGDPATMRNVMAPIAKVLRHRNARIEGKLVAPEHPDPRRRVGVVEPPFELGPSDVPLSPLAFDVAEAESWPGARPLVKAAALLSGIRAEGTTQLYERELGDDTVPGLLAAAGVPLRSLGPLTELDGPAEPVGLRGELPVDANAAVALLAVSLQPGGETVGVRRAPSRRTSSGWLEALTDAGATLAVEAKQDALGQAAADVTLRGPLERGLDLGGERAHRVGVSTAVLLPLAARAPEGAHSRLTDLEDLEEGHARLLDAFGIGTRPLNGGIAVEGVGSRRVHAVSLDVERRPDLALGAVVLSVLANPDLLLARYPRLLATLRALGATIDVVA